MKHIATVAALLALAAGTASAQSSVTLFGVMDVGVARVNNGSAGSTNSMQPGGASTSRFGFRGVEDLGGGLQTAFHLESGINPDTGVAGAGAVLFNRRATLSLLGGWGELRLGHDYNPSSRNTYLFEPYVGTGFGSVLNFTFAPDTTLGSGVTTRLRTSNAVAYYTPRNLGGFYGEAMVAPSERVAGNRYVGARVGYASGPLDVSVAYGRTNTATVDPFEQANLGASYNFGMAKVMGLYNQHKFGALQQRTTAASVAIPVGSGEVRALYGISNMSGGAAGTGFGNADDSKLLSFGYVHHLSKRTSLYGIYGRINNSGAANFTVDFSTSMGGGETSSGSQLGIVHRF